jgi:hypothetical protein
MAIQQNFPSSRPSLSLNFARSKKLDPRITFTRTSSATYVGEDGLIKIAPANAARFDHDPITGESLGLLIEEQRQNLWNNSNDFTTWIKQTTNPGVVGVATTTATTSPDGNFNAYRYFAEAGGGSFYSIYRGVAGISSNTSYCYSAFLKAGEVSNVRLVIFDGPGAASGTFNLSSGSINFTINSTNTTIGAGTTITNYGNGWYRCAVVFSSTLSGNGFQFKIDLAGPPSVGQGLFVYGAQLEQGAFPTSYIPTTASTVTRTADSASMTGSNFSSWYRQDEGTFVVKYRADNPINGQNQFLARASNNTYSNGVVVFIAGGGNPQISVTKDSLFDGLTGSSVVLQKNILYTTSATYKLNDLALSLNGSSVFVDASATIPDDLNRFDIGRDHAGATANGLDAGTISQITYYPSRLPNQVLQTLTK